MLFAATVAGFAAAAPSSTPPPLASPPKLPISLPAAISKAAQSSPTRSWYLPPQRVLWRSTQGVQNENGLLAAKAGQAVLVEPSPPLELASSPDMVAGVLLDFGVEVQGGIEIITPITPDQTKPRRVRIRFGESASEAMAELGGTRNAGNDHAVRDQVVTLPWLGKKFVGPSGFRFVRIDNVDPEVRVQISEVRAVLQLRDLPYIGSFRCSDERLNRIWEVGAYTVHLNMQDYLWDGIKRDRLVWLGDMHPEVSTINAVFGYTDVVPRSLDLIRNVTPPTEWMNGISSYSMWWIILQEDWWMHHADRPYLVSQHDYLVKLVQRLGTFVDAEGRETLNGMRFLDWPTSENAAAVHEGLQAMMTLAMESAARTLATLEDEKNSRFCSETAAKLRRHRPATSGRKSPAALLALANARDARETAATILKPGGPKDISTFYGFYVLLALARADETDVALDFIRTYWGGMLDAGATTFWEDFDLEWTRGAGRIDELVPPGTKDLHGDCGAYCYVGFRHSLCHGWASGPTAWMSQHVLGVQQVEPGLRKVRVTPHLGSLAWAEGSYPTPSGLLRIRHERQPDGSVKSTVEPPPGVEVVK